MRTKWNVLIIPAMLAMLVGGVATPAQAATCVVTSNADSGAGTLREKIADATYDTINFSGDMAIRLLSGQITISRSVTVDGGNYNIVISGDKDNDNAECGENEAYYDDTRHFEVSTGVAVTLRNLTLEKGCMWGEGGSINDSGTLTVDHVTFANNHSSGYSGGAISAYNTSGMLTVTGCTFAGNISDLSGGAINAYVTDLTVTNSTFYDNGANSEGGAIFLAYNNRTITNSTFVGNHATTGGAIANYQYSLAPTLVNVLIAKGSTDNSCSRLDTGNTNLTDDTSCTGIFTYSSNLQLGSLGTNGGRTQTIPLLAGSPAIDAGNDGSCPAVDQRGVARPQDGDGNGMAKCDIGAYEKESPLSAPVITTHPVSQSKYAGDTVSFSAAASGSPASTIQWQVSADSGMTWADISGANASPLTFTASMDQNGRQYRAVFTNSQGSATSSAATLTVSKGTALITLSEVSHTYDGTPKSVIFTTDPEVESVTVTYDGSETEPTNAGEYAVVATVVDQNYEGSTTGTLTIAPRAVEVTADAKTKTVGDPDPALTYSVTAGTLVEGDGFTGALTRSSGETVGTYAILQGTLSLGSNYMLTYKGAYLTIHGASSLTFSPNSLPTEGIYGGAYTQHISVVGGASPFQSITKDGALPAGMAYVYETGHNYVDIQGTPTETGSFPFTLSATDALNATGSQSYTLVINKAEPSLLVSGPGSSTYGSKFIIMAQVAGPISGEIPGGTVNFGVDNVTIEACTNVFIDGNGTAICDTTFDPPLSVGEHTLLANFVPSTQAAAFYTETQASSPHIVNQAYFYIGGDLFYDLNQNGVEDSGEPWLTDGWTIHLDTGCDGSISDTVVSDVTGYYKFNGLPGGACYRVSEVVKDGWQNTTTLADFSPLAANQPGTNIGNFRPIVVGPVSIPGGDVGAPYSQQFTATGGQMDGPFTFSMTGSAPGLSLSTTGLLSGTPAAAGSFPITIQAQDANGQTGSKDYTLVLRQALPTPTIALTSSRATSLVGELVTFKATLTGVGRVTPTGTVSFLDGGSAITGCSAVALVRGVASCATSALTAGTHTITANYGGDANYAPASRDMTQTVVTPASDLSVTIAESKDPIRINSSLVYTVTVANGGPNNSLSVQLTDTLDSHVTYGSVSAPRGWTCSQAAGVVTCNTASMASGAKAAIKITVKTPATAMTISNSASVTSTGSDPNPGNENATVSTTVVVR